MLWYRRLRYGYAFRRIRMTQPQYAIVDPADYDRLKGYQWFAHKPGKSFYARGCVVDGKTETVRATYMHQQIINVPAGMVVDHINHKGMDNRRANLRAATRAQNMRNRKKFASTLSSKYKGVSLRKSRGKWDAMITFEGKKIFLGSFKNEIDAARAYDEAAKKYHAEFACLNFPQKT